MINTSEPHFECQSCGAKFTEPDSGWDDMGTPADICPNCAGESFSWLGLSDIEERRDEEKADHDLKYQQENGEY